MPCYNKKGDLEVALPVFAAIVDPLCVGIAPPRESTAMFLHGRTYNRIAPLLSNGKVRSLTMSGRYDPWSGLPVCVQARYSGMVW